MSDNGPPEGHHYVSVSRSYDCDYGHCTAYTIEGYTIYLYDAETDRLSIDYHEEEEDDED